MKKYQIVYVQDCTEKTLIVQAMNRGAARFSFSCQVPSGKCVSVSEALTEQEKALSEAVVIEAISVSGVQKSMQLGFSDLPLFKNENQLPIF